MVFGVGVDRGHADADCRNVRENHHDQAKYFLRVCDAEGALVLDDDFGLPPAVLASSLPMEFVLILLSDALFGGFAAVPTNQMHPPRPAHKAYREVPD
eukprot:5248339-Prymnesium_polylepis.2